MAGSVLRTLRQIQTIHTEVDRRWSILVLGAGKTTPSPSHWYFEGRNILLLPRAQSHALDWSMADIGTGISTPSAALGRAQKQTAWFLFLFCFVGLVFELRGFALVKQALYCLSQLGSDVQSPKVQSFTGPSPSRPEPSSAPSADMK
jgi:hypothetical protein